MDGGLVPIVPGAILFDLMNGGDKDWGGETPYRALGAKAVTNAALDFALGTAGAGYGAAAGNSLDPDADPAAPTAQGGPIVPVDRASFNSPEAGAQPRQGNDADADDNGEEGWIGTPNDLAPGALTTNPDSEDVDLAPGAMTTNANDPIISGRIEGDPSRVDAGDRAAYDAHRADCLLLWIWEHGAASVFPLGRATLSLSDRCHTCRQIV